MCAKNVDEIDGRTFESPADELVYKMIHDFFNGFKVGEMDLAFNNNPSCMEAAMDLVKSRNLSN